MWAASGGCLYFLGSVGFDLWYLAPVCLVPLLVAVEAAPRRRSAVLCGLVYGLVTYAGGYHWLPASIHRFSALGWGASWALAAVFFLYMAGRDVLFVWLYRLARDHGYPVPVAAPVALVAAEFVYPFLFPTFLGSSLHPVPLLIQVADLGGALLLSAALASMNVAAWCLVRGSARADRAAIGAGAAALAVLVGYGAVRGPQIDRAAGDAPALRVGIVQPNVGISEKREHPMAGLEQHLSQSVELEREQSVDLLLWSETAFPMFLPAGVGRVGPYVTAGRIAAPLLFGGKRRSDAGLFNAAFLIDGDGQLAGQYDKVHVFPVGERVPFAGRVRTLRRWFPRAAGLTPGRAVAPLPLGSTRILTLICYEELLPGFVRRAVLAGAPQLLVDLTNDAWFGDSNEPRIRVALAKLRAVEHRRYLVRAANSGVSAVIDPVGRVPVASGVLTRENLHGEVRLLDLETPYQKLGDWPGWLALLVMAGLLLTVRTPG